MVTKNKKKAKARPASAKGLAVGQSGANQWGKARSKLARAKAKPASKKPKGTGYRQGPADGSRRMIGGQGTAGSGASGVATAASRKALSARPKGKLPAAPSSNKMKAQRKRYARSTKPLK